MTITENGRRPARTREQLMQEAREAVGTGPLPSREALRKTLGTRFDRASEVYDTLFRERSEQRAQRSREVRAQLARARRRKSSGSPRVAVLAPLPGPAAPESITQAAASTRPLPAFDYAVPVGPMPAPIREEVVQAPAGSVATSSQKRRKPVATWPIFLLALPAFVAIWSGWVDLGRLTGFGVVAPFPGIPKLEDFRLNTAITLPIGLETYAAYALYVWLSGQVPAVACRFAKWSAIGSLALGALGQIAYHLLMAAGATQAPDWITTIVACLPVAVLGMGAALRHLVNAEEGAK
jgi:hypothetical protein